MVIFALLADARLLAVRSDGSTIAELRLGPAAPADADMAAGHDLALSGDGRRLYALVRGQPGLSDRLAVIDAASAQSVSNFPLPHGLTFRSLALGPRTGQVYLFGNTGDVIRPPGADPLAQHQVSVVVAVLDPATGGVAATWMARQADGHDWRVYQGSVSPDERRLFVSYHGPDTTGIDWFDLTPNGLQRCPAADRPNLGCIAAHGGFVVREDGFLATDGSPVIRELDPAGRVRRGFVTRLEGNHLMEFVMDPRAQRLYAVGSCGYSGGFSAVSLQDGGVPTTPTAPGAWTWISTPEPPRTFRRGGACGERLALGGSTLLVVGQTQRPVPQVGKPGALLLMDPETGEVVHTVPTPSEPLDVVVATLAR